MTLDMNQDNYLGEAFKLRNLLEGFRGNVRLVGFREHIFSEEGGAVASFAAANEFVFGTIVQRFLTWPLCVRFHYGHPDVWDKVWAVSNGGVSKASRTLHVSEDIFGGINVVLRGGAVEYYEFIHCGKGRDITFGGVNGFEQKIAGGNAYQAVSRDLSRLGARADLPRVFSLFSTGVGRPTWAPHCSRGPFISSSSASCCSPRPTARPSSRIRTFPSTWTCPGIPGPTTRATSCNWASS